MPHRLNEFRAKVQFITFARMPSLIFRACVATDTVSNTRYIQEAVCERLSRDLDIPVEELLAELPPCAGMSSTLFGDDRRPFKRSSLPTEKAQ